MPRRKRLYSSISRRISESKIPGRIPAHYIRRPRMPHIHAISSQTPSAKVILHFHFHTPPCRILLKTRYLVEGPLKRDKYETRLPRSSRGSGRRGQFLRPMPLQFPRRLLRHPTPDALAAEPPFLAPQNPEIGRLMDAYLAATAEELARQYQFPRPSWTAGDARVLHQPWFASPLASLRTTLLRESPPSFRARNIFVS